MNKKGSLLDAMQIAILVFVMALIIILSSFILTTFQEDTEDKLTSPYAQNALAKGQTTLLNFDNLYAFILVGLTLGAMIGAYFIRTTPALFWISTLLLVIFLTISGIFTNVFEEVVADEVLNATAGNFSIITTIMGNLPLTILIVAALISIALWAKWRSV